MHVHARKEGIKKNEEDVCILISFPLSSFETKQMSFETEQKKYIFPLVSFHFLCRIKQKKITNFSIISKHTLRLFSDHKKEMSVHARAHHFVHYSLLSVHARASSLFRSLATKIGLSPSTYPYVHNISLFYFLSLTCHTLQRLCLALSKKKNVIQTNIFKGKSHYWSV